MSISNEINAYENVLDAYLSKVGEQKVAETKNTKNESKILSGVITKMNEKFVWVDVGAKEEGKILKDEFMYDGKLIDLNLGDVVQVCREVSEDGHGTIFSHHRARKELVWGELEKAYMQRTNLDGKIVAKAHGGFTVEIMHAPLYLPEKQLDSAEASNKNLIGQVLKFRITRMDKKKGSVIISRKQALELEEDKTLQIGTIITGVITEVNAEQAQLSYKEYKLVMYVKDYMWDSVENLDTILSVGQELRVKVVGHEKHGRIKVGHKQLLTDPWFESVQYAGINVGSMLRATVHSLEKSGAFLLLETKPILLGYLRADEIAWTRKNIIPSEVLQIEKTATVLVTEIDKKKHVVYLSIKKCNTNPLIAFSKKHQVGAELEGIVEDISSLGAVIKLEHDVEGVVQGVECTVGEKVTVVISSIDVDNYDLVLSLKNYNNPKEFQAWKHVKIGSVMNFNIDKIEENHILVTSANKVDGIIRRADLPDGSNLEDYTVGQEIAATVIDKDEKQMKLILSEINAL